MSNALLEAMASGVAPVVTPVGAHGQVIRDHENGLLVGVGKVEELRAALTLLVRDKALRRSLGEAARESALQFGIKSVVDRICFEYQSITGADFRSPPT
jgi:glycosyltransferase involved in cell wall biosynthesis